MQLTQYKFTRYHSQEWMLLVECGYVTMTVDNDGIATMLYHKGEF